MLEDSGEVDVVAAVGNADELRDAVRRLAPQAVLTDIRMPPGHHMGASRPLMPSDTANTRNRRRRAVPAHRRVVRLCAATGRHRRSCLLLKDRLADREDLVRAVTDLHHQRVDVDDRVDSGDPADGCPPGRTTNPLPQHPPGNGLTPTAIAQLPNTLCAVRCCCDPSAAAGARAPG